MCAEALQKFRVAVHNVVEPVEPALHSHFSPAAKALVLFWSVWVHATGVAWQVCGVPAQNSPVAQVAPPLQRQLDAVGIFRAVSEQEGRTMRRQQAVRSTVVQVSLAHEMSPGDGFNAPVNSELAGQIVASDEDAMVSHLTGGAFA